MENHIGILIPLKWDGPEWLKTAIDPYLPSPYKARWEIVKLSIPVEHFKIGDNLGKLWIDSPWQFHCVERYNTFEEARLEVERIRLGEIMSLFVLS